MGLIQEVHYVLSNGDNSTHFPNWFFSHKYYASSYSTVSIPDQAGQKPVNQRMKKLKYMREFKDESKHFL